MTDQTTIGNPRSIQYRTYRPCLKGRCAPPVHMIKLTETREIALYTRVHPDEDR